MINIITTATKFHGLSKFITIDMFVEKVVNFLIKASGGKRAFRHKLVASFFEFEATKPFIKDPERFLKSMAIVQSSANKNNKGIITIAYNYAFPSFMLLFDIQKIQKKYHIVLEPSTARFLMPEILIFDNLDSKVFVESGEPRDSEFLNRYHSKLIPIPIAANWWLNPNIFKEDESISKEFDIIMVSSFLKLKRHTLLFSAMKKMNIMGHKLKAVLIGYSGDITKAQLEQEARSYGVYDQVTFIENITPEEVAQYYQQSKVNLLLSKREGFNRSIIEGLYCGVPILLREGFNFGYKYPYIKENSGGYYRDSTLHLDILNMIEKINKGFIDTSSALRKIDIGPYTAAEILRSSIYGQTKDIYVAPKASSLHGMDYIDESDDSRFENDYLFLKECVNIKFVAS